MKNILSTIFALSVALSAGTAYARPHGNGNNGLGNQNQRTYGYVGSQSGFGLSLNYQDPARTISLREIREIIASQVPGDIQDARLIEDSGRKVYEVRWQPSDAQLRGRIIIFIVDAESGQILSRRGG